MFEITVEDEFSAAHFLKLYDGSWEHRHGHNWKVAVVARSETLDSIGVVVDFERLKPALKKVLAEFHETSFNDHAHFKDAKNNPSTENIARLICDRLLSALPPGSARIEKVSVWETPDASATYYP
jgi:6-pyruvoyltetrahydropterin/6-carboxytetrahydropterin synthase